MGIAQTVGAVLLVFLLPAVDLAPLLRLKRASSREARLRVYRFEMALLWVATLIAAVLLRGHRLLSVASPGFGMPWVLVAGAFVAAYFVASLSVGLLCGVNARIRAKYAKSFEKLRFLLPVSRVERLRWIGLSVSAGICEEFLYRGFLLAYLRGELQGGPHWGWLIAWLLSSLAFGAAHLYQGGSGIMGSAIAGLAFGMTAMLTGSLLLPMALHALVDLQVLWMYRPSASQVSA